MKNLIKQIAILAALLLTAQVAGATALSAPRATASKNGGAVKRYLMKASTTIYAGGLVMLNTSGTVEPAAASATAKQVVGVSNETKTSAASGSYYVDVQEGWFKLVGATLGQEDVGSLVYADDDQTVDDAWASNEIPAGILMEYVSASIGWVWVSSVFRPFDSLVGAQGGTMVNTTDGAWTLADASEDLTCTFSANLATFSSSTGATVAFTPAVGFTGIATFSDAVTLSDAATIDQASNGNVTITEASEGLAFDFSANLIDIDSSGTGASITVTTSSTFQILNGGVTAGWTAASAGNQACATTCAGTGACLFGLDAGTPALVDCAGATADTCICGGPAS